MVNEDSHEIVSEPDAGAPRNRDKPPNEAVIEGEASRVDEDAVAPEPEVAKAAELEAESARSEPPPPESPPRDRYVPPPPPEARRPGVLPALLAGLVGGALVAAGASALLPKPSLSEADANRLATLESATTRDSSAIAGLDKRVQSLEGASTAALAAVDKRVQSLEGASTAALAAVDKRVGALETKAPAPSGSEAPSGSGAPSGSDASNEAVQSLSGDVKAIRADVDATRGAIPDIAARVAKLEAGGPPADLTPLTGRIDKIESALAAPKVEKPPIDNPAAIAIVSEALRDKLASGASYPSELSALTALGVDPAALEPLKALVDGAPTNRALAADFEAAEPKLLSAVAPVETGGVADKFLAHLRGLIQIHRVGEVAGDDPAALASQIAASLQRGDLDGALAAYGKLPAAARQAASGWAAEAQRKQAAVAAVQAVRESAVTRLAQSGKP
jgi:hypothetical protein